MGWIQYVTLKRGNRMNNLMRLLNVKLNFEQRERVSKLIQDFVDEDVSYEDIAHIIVVLKL